MLFIAVLRSGSLSFLAHVSMWFDVQYRAESTFITSGVAGNYEKSLETGPTIANSVNPHASPRVVASNIIDEAVKGEFDCTGAVGADGTHSSGIPPCPPVEKFDNNLHEIESGAVPETTPAAK